METSETAAERPMYEIATVRGAGKCGCGCRLPVTVIVYIAAEAITDLAKARTKVEKLGPEITLLSVE